MFMGYLWWIFHKLVIAAYSLLKNSDGHSIPQSGCNRLNSTWNGRKFHHGDCSFPLLYHPPEWNLPWKLAISIGVPFSRLDFSILYHSSEWNFPLKFEISVDVPVSRPDFSIIVTVPRMEFSDIEWNFPPVVRKKEHYLGLEPASFGLQCRNSVTVPYFLM